MDRKETARQTCSGYAAERDIDEGTARTLPGSTSREHNQGAEPDTAAAEDIAQPVGAEPRSHVTARDDVGSGANETVDGLNDTEEMTRRAAEDTAPGTSRARYARVRSRTHNSENLARKAKARPIRPDPPLRPVLLRAGAACGRP
jgi:hypothetical protein